MSRCIEKSRKTFETDIKVKIDLDGTGQSNIDTGIGFLDHMLTLMAFHGQLDLDIKAVGDVYIDDHHTVEDLGLLLGDCIKTCLQDKPVKRYGTMYMVMDEALTRVVMDCSNRPVLVYNAVFKQDRLGTLSVQSIEEFFKSLSQRAGISLHIDNIRGENDHHIAESIFKGFGRAFFDASRVNDKLLSTKGVI